ncbi:hypothetical protein [Allorhodopirellula heiligendammensis]|uniref:Peptide synthase n=1 Tax=Allorhodopirellula heiligendammensis TaxID=2714739 RepID=A0A5C6C2F2_9BACT|nr:hypothetical protein [Allorhodopirellula heiligendammensis]TWU18663.1 peptide synthase [Allorhodopirellula heiligendammensis]
MPRIEDEPVDRRVGGRIPTASDPFLLTSFEKYFIADERRPDFPATVPLRWTVSDVPQRDQFAAAFRTAISWHPMLGCLVRRGGWQPHSEAVGEVAYFPKGERPRNEDRAVDPHKGPIMRCNVLESDPESGGATVIELVVHHAVIDGVSLIEFIGDVFAIYANAIGSLDASKLRRPHHRYLVKRQLVDRQIPSPVSRATAWKVMASESLRFFTRRAEPFVSERPEPRRGGHPAWHLVDASLDRATTDRLAASASELNATLNDFAVASLLRVIGQWNDRHRRRLGRGWLVANMPVLLRPRAAVRTSAANMIGYGLIARQRDSLADWSTLAQGIAIESRFIQQWKMAALFLDGLSAASRLPGGLFLGTRLTRPATCVVTHIGDPLRRFRVKFPVNEDGLPIVGDLTLLRMSGAAPLRPGTHVAGMLHTLGGCLGLSLRVPPSHVSLENASELISLWKQDLVSHR